MNISPDIPIDERFTTTVRRVPSSRRIHEVEVYDRHRDRSEFFKTQKAAQAGIVNILRKEVTQSVANVLRAEVKRALHSARDTMRLRGIDTTKTTYTTNVDTGLAYGITEALVLAGFGTSEGMNKWRQDIEQEVLREEGFGGDNVCARCYSRYDRDGARPPRKL